jgi:hypothetical protein
MKNLPLSNSSSPALVDDDVFDQASHWKWRLDSQGYPARDTHIGGQKVHIRLHIFTGKRSSPEPGCFDHINGNKLDNRRQNIRWVTRRINVLNTRKRTGVSWHHRNKAWRVRFEIGGKELHFGNFANREEAFSVAALLKGALIYHELTKGDCGGH